MNRIFLLLTCTLLLNSCLSFGSKTDVYTFSPLELDKTIGLGEIIIEPVHGINGIEEILPEVILSVANESGFNLLLDNKDCKLTMDIYLHRKSYLKGFQKFESVTLMVKINNVNGIVTNAVYTRDSKTPLDSFSKVYEIFQDVMPELRKEYESIQKQIEKGELI